MARTVLLTASENEVKRSLARFLRSRLCASHSLLVKLKAGACVRVNGETSRLDRVIMPLDRVEVDIPARWDEVGEEPTLAQADISVPVIYEDEDFAVFAKPAGLPCHPSPGHRDDTLANGFARMYPGIPCRTVTRLDAGTSGAVLVAKNMLSGAIDRESVTRIYYGLTDRPVNFTRKTVRLPIERELPERPRRIVTPEGRPAVTHMARIKTFENGLTLLRFRLETGRTHQIRVHCAALGIPLCGDSLYGGTGDIGRTALHAGYLGFRNNVTGKRVWVKAKLAEDFLKLVKIEGLL